MITKWGVTNFKSIREADLDLAPLTVFTGVNSSGKSSFLDSILMAAQLPDERFKLNPYNIQLGEVKHIFHNHASGLSSIDYDFIIDDLLINFSLMPYNSETYITETNTMKVENLKVYEKIEDLEELERDDEHERYQELYEEPCDWDDEHEAFLEIYNNRKTFLKDVFSLKNFRYLGPFRDPSQFSNKKDDECVNSDGSNTFAVLNKLYKENKNVPYCFPDQIEKKKYVSTFIETFGFWIKHFEIADTCKVDDNGELKFYKDREEYTLQQLGSSVSQIMPIFGMCIPAPIGSTIIIKEPEVHLHPKTQSYLADFFVEMALSGRQCLIETHSEYLVEQLRYNIVMLSDRKPEPLHIITKMYFVTKEAGVSQYKDIVIDENASLDDWPDDFFDETHKIIRKMTEAIAKKEELDEEND